MFQAILLKIDKFGWWDWERISAGAGTQFISAEFQGECQTRGVWLTLAAPVHQEMNRQFKVTWIMLGMIVHPLMAYERVLEAYINFVLMNMEDHILQVLTTKYLINEDIKPTTPFKLATITKPSI